MKHAVLLVLTGLLLSPVGKATAQAQATSKNQPTTQAKKELDEAKAKLKDESHDLDKAEKEADKADAARKAAAAKVLHARQSAIAEHGKKLGLPIALGQRDAATRALASAHTTLAKQIRASTEHQSAVKEAEQAKTRLETVREDASVSDDKKKQLTTDLSKTIRAPVALEREQLDTNPQIRDLRAKLAEANKQAAIIQAQVQKAGEEAAGVKTALQHERESEEKAKTAHAEVDKHKREVTTAQKKVTNENQQLQSVQSKAAATKKKTDKAK